MNSGWKLRLRLVYVAIGLALLMLPTGAYAHGARVEYIGSTAIEIVAKYDNGEPMGGAQVVVYAPDDPSTPWLTGTCDSEGSFTFTPDSSKPGTWDVQVRQAGHGDMVHISVEDGMVGSSGAGGYSVTQIVLMSVCVIWGIIGTALYLSRRRT